MLVALGNVLFVSIILALARVGYLGEKRDDEEERA
jgi:hypothetical protein